MSPRRAAGLPIALSFYSQGPKTINWMPSVAFTCALSAVSITSGIGTPGMPAIIAASAGLASGEAVSAVEAALAAASTPALADPPSDALADADPVAEPDAAPDAAPEPDALPAL